jgi:putative hydrolase of the HAD superfamily
MRPLCVVFDIDDTLYLERDYVASGFRAVGQWAAEWLGISNFAEVSMSIFQSGVRSRIFDQAAESFGIEPSSSLIQSMVEIYRTHTPEISLAPDAVNALPSIARRWPIAVLTDGPPASQSAKARALGLPEFANPIVLTGCLGAGFGKPHTRGFEQVQQVIAASQFIYVADNPYKDFAGPRSLGWGTVRVRRSGGLHSTAESTRPAPDFELQDFSRLDAVLSGLNVNP